MLTLAVFYKYRTSLYRRYSLRLKRAVKPSDPEGSKPWHQRKAFLKERRKWYAKLKRSGFHDMELTDWSTGESRECLDGISQADIVNTWSPEQEEYYRLAVHWVHVMELRRKRSVAKQMGLPPTSAREVKVWALHADGVAYTRIGERIRTGKGPVSTIVNREKQLMLAFDWSTLDPDEG